MIGAFWARRLHHVCVGEGAATALIIVLMLVAAMVGAGVVSVAVERFAYRPLRYAPRIAPLISALGVSFLLQNLVQITVGAQPWNLRRQRALIPTDARAEGGRSAHIHAARLLVIGLTFGLMLALTCVCAAHAAEAGP
ncbi:MAG: hypothetical protein R2911_42400 [Caldilineaceae bacterium]